MSVQLNKAVQIDDARALVAISMLKDNKLNDDTLPPEKYKIFIEQPFSQWPADMQSELSKYGAPIIV